MREEYTDSSNGLYLIFISRRMKHLIICKQILIKTPVEPLLPEQTNQTIKSSPTLIETHSIFCW